MLDGKIKVDRSVRKRDLGQLNKHINPLLDSLDHRARRKERQVGEAQKNRVKLT
jgi:hypothetical protein